MASSSLAVSGGWTPGRPWARGVGRGGTHIDEVVPVADEQVAQDASLVEVPQADHVLHAVDRRGVHGLDVRGLLRGDPVFLREARGFYQCALLRPRLRSAGRKGTPGPCDPAEGLFSSAAQRHGH